MGLKVMLSLTLEIALLPPEAPSVVPRAAAVPVRVRLLPPPPLHPLLLPAAPQHRLQEPRAVSHDGGREILKGKRGTFSY